MERIEFKFVLFLFYPTPLYADDVDIIGRSDCEVVLEFSEFAMEAWKIGLSVNESKTKQLLSSKARDFSIVESVEIP